MIRFADKESSYGATDYLTMANGLTTNVMDKALAPKKAESHMKASFNLIRNMGLGLKNSLTATMKAILKMINW